MKRVFFLSAEMSHARTKSESTRESETHHNNIDDDVPSN